MNNLEKSISGEREYFNSLAETRKKRGIPCEADMNTNTLYIPKNIEEELIDAKLKSILLEPHRTKALKALFCSPEGTILDVCCGPGWVCLQGARNGREMLGYDISDKALELAAEVYTNRLREEAFVGSAIYRNRSIEGEDFLNMKIAGAMGWSAFHHLSDPGAFLDKLHENMLHNATIVTMDDLDSDKASKLIRYLLKFIFPIYEYTYFEKIKFALSLISGTKKLNTMLHSPMEIYADKHGAAADIIKDRLTTRFVPIYDVEFGAFSIYVCHSLKGPNWWRYTLSKCITYLDTILIKLRIVRGSYRLIISKKL